MKSRSRKPKKVTITQPFYEDPVSDIIHDHTPRRAPGHKVKSVLSILDQLEKQNVNRRFTT